MNHLKHLGVEDIRVEPTFDGLGFAIVIFSSSNSSLCTAAILKTHFSESEDVFHVYLCYGKFNREYFPRKKYTVERLGRFYDTPHGRDTGSKALPFLYIADCLTDVLNSDTEYIMDTLMEEDDDEEYEEDV